MKYINLSLLLVVFCFTACQKNQDLTNTEFKNPESVLVATTDLTIEGGVGEFGSILHWTNLNFRLHNVKIQLMFNGETLDETNSDERGSFSFPTQPIPNEGAYLLFESPGFYNNVEKIDTLPTSIYYTNLLRKTFPAIDGEAISDGGPYIKLKGILQDPLTAGVAPLYYITNADNELIGNTTPMDDNTAFTITTLANEELFLNYKIDCHPIGTIPLGSLTEDTDLGALLDQSFDLSTGFAGGFFSNVYDCPGNIISEYSIFFTADGLTTHSWGTAGYGTWKCKLLANPVIVTIATQNPRKYQEKIIDYAAGQSLSTDMTVCTDDDTFIKYTIGNGTEVTPDLFTYANILPDGKVLLKQKDPDYDNGTDITFIISDAEPGTNSSEVVFYSGGIDIILGGNDIMTTITANDGEFVEGTFSGEAFDAYEGSMGNLTGSFKARIQ